MKYFIALVLSKGCLYIIKFVKFVLYIPIINLHRIIPKKLMKLVGSGSNAPGRVAFRICPDFLDHRKKPKLIIGVTGTNGKTTVCNVLIDILKLNGYKILDNKEGSNSLPGIISTFLKAKGNEEIAVLEMDERSSKYIYRYINPDYVIITNLFRDSMRRHAHSEFIRDFINDYIPESTKIIVNADDLIACSIGNKNKKIYYGMDKLQSDKKISDNIVKDITTCPKCDAPLKYEYVKYHHIGKCYCSKCDFKSPEADYFGTNIDFKTNKIGVKIENKIINYPLISNSIFNIYNELSVIALLSEIKMSSNDIINGLNSIEIIKSRYDSVKVNDIDIVSIFAKGQNAVACSTVFKYVKEETGKKEVILILDDVVDNEKSSEKVNWYYDTDYEFLNDESIKKIIIGGPRNKDNYLRLLLAGCPKDKLFKTEKEIDTIKYVSKKDIDKIFIIHDIYTIDIMDELIKKIGE